MKFFIFTVCFFSFVSSFFAFEPIPTSNLLISYLENDADLKKNAIEAKKSALLLDSTKISQAFNINLSTGQISIFSDNQGTNFSIKPSVDFSIPSISNLNVKASTNLSYKNNYQLEDSKISLNIDIISSSKLSEKVAILKAERKLLEAKRKLKKQAINSEKIFYTELKALINSTSEIINAQKTLYTNKIDFEKIKAQGYSTNSSTYRLAQMKVLSTEHEIENLSHSLIHSYVSFYKKCGYNINIDSNTDFYQLLPTDITEIMPLDVHSFNPDFYEEIDEALWQNKINSMERNIKNNFSLIGKTGINFNNSITKSTTVDAGLSTQISGLNLDAEINLPVEKETKPSFSFSASINPKSFYLNKITEETKNLSLEQELLNIETARINYQRKIVELEQKLEDLQWTRKSDLETYKMYAQLEKDLQAWYQEGFVSESEYYSAKVNTKAYAVKQIINTLDFIIYNDNIITMFVEDILE